MFYLEGKYSIENIDLLKKTLDEIHTKIDYSKAEIDSYVKIVIDSINQKKQINQEKYIEKKIPISAKISDIILYTHQLFLVFKMIFSKIRKPHHATFIAQDIKSSLYTMSIKAIPITVFLGLLLGISITMQSTKQLRVFGCEIYVLDLLVFTFFKEMGLLVSIMILTSRSGSAMIAKIGFMKISQEWDSLKIMQINPNIFLLQPKIVSFALSVPFLAYIACFSGLIGGYIVLWLQMKLSLLFFFQAIFEIIDYQTLFSVAIKGPVLGVLIGVICALESIKISINAESIIESISRGVIYSTCFCIFFDVLFNVFVFGV